MHLLLSHVEPLSCKWALLPKNTQNLCVFQRFPEPILSTSSFGKVKTLIGSIVFTIVCGGGFAFLTTETRPEKQWVPAGLGEKNLGVVNSVKRNYKSKTQKVIVDGFQRFFCVNTWKYSHDFYMLSMQVGSPQKSCFFKESLQSKSFKQKKYQSHKFPKKLGISRFFWWFGKEFYFGSIFPIRSLVFCPPCRLLSLGSWCLRSLVFFTGKGERLGRQGGVGGLEELSGWFLFYSWIIWWSHLKFKGLDLEILATKSQRWSQKHLWRSYITTSLGLVLGK